MTILEYTVNYLLLPFLIFIILFFLVNKDRQSARLDSVASWLNGRGLFFSKDLIADQRVIDGARILLGLIFLYRLYHIGVFALPLGPNNVELLALGLYAVLCITFTLGLLAPVSALLLLLFQLHFNFSLLTYNLANDISAMILLCFVLYPVGQSLSTDSLLVKRHAWIAKIYVFFTHSNRHTQITLAKAISFYSYCLLCLYSVLLHINEPMWVNGEAGIHLLGSSYLSRYPDFFQYWFANSQLAVMLGKASMLGMVAWYIFLGPAVLIGGVLRKLVILWAIAFFLVSAFVLRLSVLPYVEFILLFIWFWNLYRPRSRKSLNMLYDDRCNLCDRTVRSLRILDLHQVINYRPVSQNKNLAEKVGVTEEELYKNLYCWDEESNRVYAGYDFYLHLSRSILLLFPVVPILWSFKILLIGPWVYKQVAKYRIQWFGVCQLPTDTATDVELPILDAVESIVNKSGFSKGLFRPFLFTSLLFSIAFLTFLPGSPLKASITQSWPELIRSAHILSWTRINVFNREDLGMSQHYFTVEALSSEPPRLLPFTATDGSRLNWHNSDRVYFGNSLRWRRWKNVRAMLPPHKNDIKKYCEIMTWANAQNIEATQGFKFTFYQAEWPYPHDGLFTFPSANITGSAQFRLEDCAS